LDSADALLTCDNCPEDDVEAPVTPGTIWATSIAWDVPGLQR